MEKDICKKDLERDRGVSNLEESLERSRKGPRCHKLRNISEREVLRCQKSRKISGEV